MQGIALQTRKTKQYGVNGGTWRDQARARAAEHGFGHGELVRLQGRARARAGELDASKLAASLSGPQGLTRMHNTFARGHALAEIAGFFEQGASVSQLEQAVSSYLEDPSVRSLVVQSENERRYTTEDLLSRERDIIEGAKRRSTEQTGVLAGELVDRVISGYLPALNDEQATAVRGISTNGRGVEAVTALAGTGKTTMIGALAACYAQASWRVLGAAPSGRAARELRNMAGIPATTMHALLAQLEQDGGLASRTVVRLDEAGMAPTRQTAELFAYAERAEAKVIAAGDPGQLRSVEAGGWLGAIARRQPTPALREVMRHRDRKERAALEALHGGQPDPYLAHKQASIIVHAWESDALTDAVRGWQAAQREQKDERAVMIARDNHTCRQLNELARQQLSLDGLLPLDGVQVGGRQYAPGDRVIARRNDRYHDVDNGTLGTVVDIDRDGALLLKTDRGETRRLDRGYVADHVEHAYALTGHGAQGATVAWAAVVGRPDEFTREWAYTALSRARDGTVIHVISEQPETGREREQYAPAQPDRPAAQTYRALRRAMKRCETEPLALEQLNTKLRPAPLAPVPRPPSPASARTAEGKHRGQGPPTQTLELALPRAEPLVVQPSDRTAGEIGKQEDPRSAHPPRPPHAEPDGLELLRRSRRGPGRALSS
jgi:hypothetical protein